MKGSRRRQPGVERLEAKSLLSSMSALPAPLAQGAIHVATIAEPNPNFDHQIFLSGTAHGVYTRHNGLPDVGASYSVLAIGKLVPTGRTVAAGSLHSLGFIGQGHATGTLWLVAPGGVLKLELTGPVQNGFSALPGEFTFRVTAGTGRYRHDTGSGTVDVALTSPTGSPGPGSVQHGQAALVFHSTPPPPPRPAFPGAG